MRARGMTDAAWDAYAPTGAGIAEQFSVQEMVEKKVLGFSTQRMEEIVAG